MDVFGGWAALPQCICVDHDDGLQHVLHVAAERGSAETCLNSTNIVMVRR